MRKFCITVFFDSAEPALQRTLWACDPEDAVAQMLRYLALEFGLEPDMPHSYTLGQPSLQTVTPSLDWSSGR